MQKRLLIILIALGLLSGGCKNFLDERPQSELTPEQFWQTEDDINADDREDELAIFNEKIKPILANLGFPVDGGSFIHEPEAKEVPVKDKVDNAIRLKKEAGLPIDDDYLYEMSGIPKPANYDALKKQQEEKQAEPPIPAPPSKKKNKGGQPQSTDDEKLAWIDKLRLTLADFFDLAPKS